MPGSVTGWKDRSDDGFASSMQCIKLALYAGMKSEPSTAQRELRGTTDISTSPLVYSSLCTNSGLLCWMIKNLPSSSRSSRSLITFWPTETLVFSIRLENVFSLSFFRDNFEVLSSLSCTTSWNLSWHFCLNCRCLLWHFQVQEQRKPDSSQESPLWTGCHQSAF